ncbi:NERD domain-containing protein [Halomonas chromatireducens]|uniref:Nuclease-related domain protein n=1 Tax=Halomonas chromatireducens TaxID=507626 RepID=A0A0X8HE74_9GAMM|nr:NERD domain-containing protein [Halomonas chromatireducens]AMD00991.1 Nuclease-related domain protein [Halomonas chromatireducens]
MDYAIIFEAARPLWWVLPLVVLLGIFKTRWFKGLFGEAFVKLIAKVRLPADEYRGIHNVTLATPDGTTQIDHVLVSRYGIFVIETKHMTGWIFGSERQAQWTQKIYRKSFKFQNPLRQNYKHVKALEALLDVPADTIHSLVVFSGSAVFKTRMPGNVTIGGGYVRYIRSFREPVLSDSQVQEVLESITTGRLAPNRQTHRQHVKHLKARFESSAERTCSKCGSGMVLRTSKRSANAGNRFWGCSAYPKCREVQDVA